MFSSLNILHRLVSLKSSLLTVLPKYPFSFMVSQGSLFLSPTSHTGIQPVVCFTAIISSCSSGIMPNLPVSPVLGEVPGILCRMIE